MNHAIRDVFVFDDGGRQAAGFRGRTGDCVVRSIAIVSGTPYRDVYQRLFALAKRAIDQPYRNAHEELFALTHAHETTTRAHCSPRNGVSRAIYEPYLLDFGYLWTPTMSIGSGCRVHLRREELPPGRLIVQLSRHLTAVIDGIVHDTVDCSRGGKRCVYGYYKKG
ncbi:MAG: hypothetical protein ACREXT_10410 [Gammaproteobacteria bacterium]